MSDDDEEEESVAGDLGPAYLTMGVTASVLRAYHRIARMLRKAWTDMRFGRSRRSIPSSRSRNVASLHAWGWKSRLEDVAHDIA
ncbi:hypothetical protein MRX96_007362 [Rhipicephalus microplus]